MKVIEYETRYFRNWAWTVTFGFIVLLLIVAKLFNKDKKVRKQCLKK